MKMMKFNPKKKNLSSKAVQNLIITTEWKEVWFDEDVINKTIDILLRQIESLVFILFI